MYLQTYWTRLSPLQAKSCSGGNPRLKCNRAGGDSLRPDRPFGRPEIHNTEDEKAGKHVLISSLTKQVESFPNKSMLIAELIKPCAQQKARMIQRFMQHETRSLNDGGSCALPICHRYSRAGEACCGCGRTLQGITGEIWKQAEHRIGTRFIMYVPDMYDSAS